RLTARRGPLEPEMEVRFLPPEHHTPRKDGLPVSGRKHGVRLRWTGWTFPYIREGAIASRITAAARAPARRSTCCPGLPFALVPGPMARGLGELSTRQWATVSLGWFAMVVGTLLGVGTLYYSVVSLSAGSPEFTAIVLFIGGVFATTLIVSGWWLGCGLGAA